MEPYNDRVLNIIENFSVLGGSIIDFAKGIFLDSDINYMYPSNAAICCLNVANEYLTGSPLKSFWDDIMYVLHTADYRKRKPTMGRKLYRNILMNSEKIKNSVDLEKHKILVEVTYGSKISRADEESIS